MDGRPLHYPVTTHHSSIQSARVCLTLAIRVAAWRFLSQGTMRACSPPAKLVSWLPKLPLSFWISDFSSYHQPFSIDITRLAQPPNINLPSFLTNTYPLPPLYHLSTTSFPLTLFSATVLSAPYTSLSTSILSPGIPRFPLPPGPSQPRPPIRFLGSFEFHFCVLPSCFLRCGTCLISTCIDPTT